jgi:hypothetical protein
VYPFLKVSVFNQRNISRSTGFLKNNLVANRHTKRPLTREKKTMNGPRIFNQGLLSFLGPSLSTIWLENLELFRQKKAVQIFRHCEEWKKFGLLLGRVKA